MEGNFRIVQRSENDFIIEKEFGRERFKWMFCPFITVKEKYWCLVDHRGEKCSLGCIFIREKRSIFQYSSFETAVRVLENIKKFPIVVYPGSSENNIPAHRTPPPPPLPSKPRTVNESTAPSKENDPYRKRDDQFYMDYAKDGLIGAANQYVIIQKLTSDQKDYLIELENEKNELLNGIAEEVRKRKAEVYKEYCVKSVNYLKQNNN